MAADVQSVVIERRIDDLESLYAAQSTDEASRRRQTPPNDPTEHPDKAKRRPAWWGRPMSEPGHIGIAPRWQ